MKNYPRVGDLLMLSVKRFLLRGLWLAALPALTFAQGVKVEYAHLDGIGNVLAVSNSAGVEIESHDYLPFGEEWCGTSVCGSVKAGQSRRFTGKERDAETGLDYFGARYFASKVGRFTTVDPAYTWQENLVDPQRWNRYAYARNNPLRYIDKDGRWPTEVHNQILAAAFPGLTSVQQQILRQASYDTDYNISVNGRGPQEPQNSFVHSMSDGVNNQKPQEAERQAQAFMRTREGWAGEQQAAFEKGGGQGLSNAALRSLGIALHTVTDGTSPAHAGYQPWNGTAGVGNSIAAANHVRRESSATPAQLAGAVGAARASFGRAFGETRLKQAIEEKPR